MVHSLEDAGTFIFIYLFHKFSEGRERYHSIYLVKFKKQSTHLQNPSFQEYTSFRNTEVTGSITRSEIEHLPVVGKFFPCMYIYMGVSQDYGTKTHQIPTNINRFNDKTLVFERCQTWKKLKSYTSWDGWVL